jgi:hypothetical protein
MNWYLAALELLLAGFFAVACMRSFIPAADEKKLNFRNLLRVPGRIERLRRSRWQWFSMVLLMLVLRLQNQLPIVLEMIVVAQFIVFIALPATAEAVQVQRR